MSVTDTQWARENLTPIRNKVKLIHSNEEIVPGITSIPAYGHTIGQIALLINSESENLLYLADAVHFFFQIAVPDASTIADMNPELAYKTRKMLLEKAYENKYRIMGFHFDFPGIGTIKKGEPFQWEFAEL